MATFGISQCHDIKQKRLHIIIQRFMVEKEFRQQTQMLTVLLLALTIDLPDTQLSLPINLTIEFSNELK